MNRRWWTCRAVKCTFTGTNGSAARPHGQLVFFAEFLAATGVFERPAPRSFATCQGHCGAVHDHTPLGRVHAVRERQRRLRPSGRSELLMTCRYGVTAGSSVSESTPRKNPAVRNWHRGWFRAIWPAPPEPMLPTAPMAFSASQNRRASAAIDTFPPACPQPLRSRGPAFAGLAPGAGCRSRACRALRLGGAEHPPGNGVERGYRPESAQVDADAAVAIHRKHRHGARAGQVERQAGAALPIRQCRWAERIEFERQYMRRQTDIRTQNLSQRMVLQQKTLARDHVPHPECRRMFGCGNGGTRGRCPSDRPLPPEPPRVHLAGGQL